MKLTLLRLAGHPGQTLAQQSPWHSLHLPGPLKGLALLSHLSFSSHFYTVVLIYSPRFASQSQFSLLDTEMERQRGAFVKPAVFSVFISSPHNSSLFFLLPLGEFQGNSSRWDKDLLIYKTNAPINIFEFWVPSETSLSPWCLNFRESKRERNGIHTNSLCVFICDHSTLFLNVNIWMELRMSIGNPLCVLSHLRQPTGFYFKDLFSQWKFRIIKSCGFTSGNLIPTICINCHVDIS